MNFMWDAFQRVIQLTIACAIGLIVLILPTSNWQRNARTFSGATISSPKMHARHIAFVDTHLRQRTLEANRRGDFAVPAAERTTNGTTRHIHENNRVALSRARTPQGLRLVGTIEQFKSRVTVNPQILRWL